MTSLEGVPCTLELEVSYKLLRGSLILDGEDFELRGFCSSQMKAAYGVLLESVSNSPVALLKITPNSSGLVLELDMPDFDDFITLYKPHAFDFRRISALLL
jgi:hypothetical protein